MTDLSDRLERLGLSQYLDAFISEGFDTWETLSDITESDLNYLGVKLGHRRKLQRAIAESRGQPPDKALIAEGAKVSSIGSDESGAEPRDQGLHGSSSHGNPSGSSGTKRKYRRHPKRDSNAPERPPSAYVIFSNQVREELKGQELTFTEIAKVVGERWQILLPDVREHCEQQANSAKEKYYSELAEYKKTTEYRQYQEYLVEFKARYGPSRTVEGKRSKLETEASSASLPAVGEVESVERGQGTRSAPNLSASMPRSSGSSPPSAGGFVTQSGFRRPSSSSSPALHSEVVNSPVKPDPYSPDGSSPAMSAAYTTKDYRQPGRGESRTPVYSGALHYAAAQPSYQPSTYRTGHGDSQLDSRPSGTTYIAALPRRPSRGSPPVPPLIHQDSTISSDSASSAPPSLSLMPILDPGKGGTRILPHPVNFGAGPPRTSPLDLRQPHSGGISSTGPSLPPITIAGGHLDPQRSSNWPALLRATELAREAAMKGADSLPDQEESP